jgi:D-aminopeptidase
VWRDEPDPPAGRGVGRSGVTAIVPADPTTLVDRPIAAGTDVLNGAGELTSSIAIREWGVIETPVYLTATMSVGRVYDGAVRAAIGADPRIGLEHFVIPVVGECDDGWLSEARVVQVELDDVSAALAAAGDGLPAEGAVGAGTGMMTFDYKAGIGTASRVLSECEATLGVLVLSNFGVREDFVLDGVPVGRLLGGERVRGSGDGSCIALVITDAALGPHELTRVARRCGLGLARTGSVGYDGSGEIFLALSTARGADALPDSELNALFEATVDATEEAVVNALWSAERVVGRDGRVAEALPHDEVVAMLRAHRRL